MIPRKILDNYELELSYHSQAPSMQTDTRESKAKTRKVCRLSDQKIAVAQITFSLEN